MKNKIIITKILYNQITLFLFILLSSSNIYSQSSNCNFPGWSNYKLFVIDNSLNPSSLTNFPVLIEFNTSTLISSSQMNADGSDIRVSGQCNGTQTFDFWFDDIDNANTRLWVKLPSIAAGSIDSIYVHYGNPSAVSAANGPNVFSYIEDFESGNLSAWSFDGGTWAIVPIQGQNSLKSTSPPTGKGSAGLLSSNLGMTDYVVEMEFIVETDGSMGGPLFEHDDFNNYNSYHLMTANNLTMISTISNNLPFYSLSEPFVAQPNIWYKWKVVRKGSTGNIDIYLNNNLQRTIPTSFSDGVGVWAYGGTATYYDNLTVRPYSQIEPVITEGSIPIASGHTVTAAVDNNVSCNGGNDGQATATQSGGTPNFTYLWSDNQTNATAVGLSANTYSVTVTDSNGYTAAAQVVITEPAGLNALITSASNPLCNNDSNGIVTVSASGGSVPYSFDIGSGNQATGTFNGLAAGSYTVTVTDNNGCVATTSISLSTPALLVVNASVSSAVSCNGSSDGEATANASGGLGALSFVWDNGQTNTTAVGLAANVYTVTVNDANACSDVASVTLTDPSAVIASANVTSAVSCASGADGTAVASGSGGTGSFTFNWDNGQTGQNVTGLSAQTYTVTVTDQNACSDVTSVLLTDPIVLSTTATGTDVIAACNSHTWIDGVTYTADNNIATHVLTNSAGCDSTVTLNLTIYNSSVGMDVITACNSHTWIDGVTYTADNNSATYVLTNAAGCDSIVTINLTINSNTGTDVITACDSYTWIDGVVITGNYYICSYC